MQHRDSEHAARTSYNVRSDVMTCHRSDFKRHALDFQHTFYFLRVTSVRVFDSNSISLPAGKVGVGEGGSKNNYRNRRSIIAVGH